MIEEGIYKWVLANEALQALMPSQNALFMGYVPESAVMPCIMFQTASDNPDVTLDGPSGYVIRRYQFNFYGTDLPTPNTPGVPGAGYVEAKNLANIFRQQITEGNNAPTGVGALTLPGLLPDGTKVFNVIPDNSFDSYDEDAQRHQIVADYFFHFSQNP